MTRNRESGRVPADAFRLWNFVVSRVRRQRRVPRRALCGAFRRCIGRAVCHIVFKTRQGIEPE